VFYINNQYAMINMQLLMLLSCISVLSVFANVDGNLPEKGYTVQVLELKPEKSERLIAVLISKCCPHLSEKAVLYIHGYNDCFFQDHLADWYLSRGYNFYALELRRYGRALLPGQTRYGIRRMTDYYEELDMAAEIIRNRDGNTFLLLNGHSTGGLIASLYASDRANTKTVDALFLNSPFFDLNAGWFVRNVMSPVFGGLGSIFPKMYLPLPVSANYGKSLHRDYAGEWDYDLALKPLENKTRAGWLRAARKAQKRVRRGLSVECPVLVMHSDKSGSDKNWNDEIAVTDVVLNVEQIKNRAHNIGKNVSVVEIPRAKHDVMLSIPEVREKVFAELQEWLDKLPVD
jgi:alpha-beta hydrolase superfamily lysophospholipase